MNKQAAALIKKAKAMEAGDSGDRWKPTKPGDTVYGTVIGIREQTGDDDVFEVCTLKTETGVISFALGTVLKNLFTANDITISDVIAISYKGQSKPKKKGFSGAKLYTIAIEGRETLSGAPASKNAKRGGKRRK